MSANSSAKPSKHRVPRWHRVPWRALAGYPLWVIVVMFGVQFGLAGVLIGLSYLGFYFDQIDPALFNSVLAAVVYVLALAIAIGLPYWLKHRATSRQELGLHRLPSWFDLLAGPLGFIPYIVLSGLLSTLAIKLLPWFDIQQAQEIGFGPAHNSIEAGLAFVTLVILAPLAEEALFRGYLYSKLRSATTYIVATLLVSLAFAVLHGQWNVGLDVFCLSLVLCSLREVTGSIWAGVILHMIKNGLAFYLLFIGPSLLQ